MERHDHDTKHRTSPLAHYDGDGILRLPDRVIEHVHADLVGGRNRYSIGGEVAEGPRWWRGRLDWPGDEDRPIGGIEITIELDNGRSAIAVIEPDPTAPEHSTVIHGVGPPPFDVS